MKKLIRNLAYFSIPIILYILGIIVVDPYNRFNVSSLIDSQSKYELTNRSHEFKSKANMLWKLIEFKRTPKDKIIVGDSQGFYFREELIEELTNEEFYNFCVPAANFETTTKVFWYAAEKVKLKKVYYQVSFALSNSHFSYNLFDEAMEFIKKPNEYVFSKEILRDSYANLMFHYTNDSVWVKDPYFEKPDAEIDSLSEAWADVIFDDYNYPESHISELQKISNYCKENNIELEFIVMPNYQWVNDYIENNGINVHQEQFMQTVASCGKVHDFSKLESICPNRDLFYDYFHCTQNVVDSLTAEIWVRK